MTVATTSPSSWPPCPPRFGTPRRLERPTRGGDLAKFAQALGTELMPWQQHVADVALEVDLRSGHLAYRRVILTVPRQSGKTTLMLAAFLHRALGMGSPQVAAYAAQNGLDARMRLQREWHKTLQRSSALRDTYSTSWATGAEALLFHNGSRLQVVAGTEKSGHGQTLDLAMVDEAFAQRDGRLEQALGPAMVTRPEPQLWFISTAGSPSDTWFRDKVERGRESVDGTEGVAFFEWSAPNDVEINDRAAWRACMPALGHTISEAVVAAECLGMAPDEFRRAYLNQWVDRGADGAFDAAVWSSLVQSSPEKPSDPVFGVALSLDQAHASIVAVGDVGGIPQISVVDARPRTDWVVDRLVTIARDAGAKVALDKGGPAASLLRDLKDARLQLVELSQGDYAQACGALLNEVNNRTIRYVPDPALEAAERGATTRALGERWAWARKGSTDISPLEAATVALHGYRTQPTTEAWGFFE